MINESTIRCWWAVLKGEGKLTEVRLLAKKGGRQKNYSGYFKSADSLLSALAPFADSDYGIYYTLNAINEACYGRIQRERFVENPTTTSDQDVMGRDLVLIDLDPKRPSDTNASDEEVKYAWEVAQRIRDFLRDSGFYSPVMAMSGNGVHLLYRVQMANTPAVQELVKDFLKALDMMFGDDRIDVDTSVFNASRIAKMIGTRSNKGFDSEERPQRLSYFIDIPDTFEVTDIAYFQKIASIIPKQEKPSRYNRFAPSEDFDVEAFFAQHNIAIHSVSKFSGGTKYVLEECPFNSNHKHPDAAVFKLDNGALGFRCLHASCQQYSWRDFRLHYDPQAYDRRAYDEHIQLQQYYAPQPPAPPQPLPETEEKGKKWLDMTDIKYVNPAKLPFVPTGILELDKKVMGLMMGDVTIISGLSGAGKTSLLDNIILNVIQRNYKVACWSGELQDFRFQSWLDQMAAGKNYVRQATGYEDLYFAPQDVCKQVNEWLKGKLFLYNNDYGNKWNQLFADIQEIVESQGVSVVVIDNLMALNLTYNGEKNEKQTQFINDLKDYAKRKNIHVILVCHPRKEQSYQLLRMESISGTADLTNLCDNLFIIHRVGRDFERRAKEFFGDWVIDNYKKYDVVLEVCKNRSYGIKDFLVGMYYEKESRRLKNDIAEHIVYGWQESGEDMPLDIYESEFDTGKDLPF